jgi:hypothetical protein
MAFKHERRPLSDDAVLIRGGNMRLGALRRSARDDLPCLGRLGLSVFGADGVSPAEILAAIPGRFPWQVVRLSTAGAVRRGGFEVEPTGQAMHQTIWLPGDDEETLATLVRLFGPLLSRADL